MTRTDEINRITWGLGAFAALFGMSVLLSAQWSLSILLPAMPAEVFAFDPAFVPVGAVLVGGLWTLNAMLFAIVFADGHWRPLTRQLDVALTAAWGAALLWLAFGPRIFLAEPTDTSAKGALLLVMVFVAASLVSKLRRLMRR
jgi:hypothetical protein